ncbi:MAG: DUF2975 domain-containing protein [Tissierellia bacterium]|nr:DUF2975 domain-containing protein [Tissierellia bacterium]
MRKEKLENIKKFGKIGYIISTIVLIIIIAAFTLIPLVGLVAGDGLKALKQANIKRNISVEIKVDKNYVEGNIKNGTIKGLDIDDMDISDWQVKDINGEKLISLKGNSETKLGASNIVRSAIFLELALLLLIINILMFRSIFKSLRDYPSPFSQDIVRKLKVFAMSLVPWIFFGGVFDYISSGAILEADYHLSVDANSLFFIAIIYVLSKIFEYGLDLQTESDDIV